tara:strand:- start:4243 stop:4662 length:420 start_codon:yes stop_codon:yes gene_type:complete
LADKYIRRPPLKCTGREYFNIDLIGGTRSIIGPESLAAEDVHATFAAYTVQSIVQAIRASGLVPARLLLCGGGAKNHELMKGSHAALSPTAVHSPEESAMGPDVVEAMAFAWFAKQRLDRIPVKLTTSGTGHARLLGAV